MTASQAHSQPHDNSIIETLQSLIVAFVLAMTFRGFVTEGFVIPTGSMAPTLLGQHNQFRSDYTGWDYAVGVDARQRQVSLDRLADPMLGPNFVGSGTSQRRARTRMGDRILVLKGLYHFRTPSRFDVVVFKNPTNPNGEDGNYIKRLIGLPREAIWLVDGDVFAGSAETPDDEPSYVIQRKPEYIQRAVWQPVHRSDFFPLNPETLDVFYPGPPWQGAGWETEGRPDYRCASAEPTMLEWDDHVRAIDDWVPYNELVQRSRRRTIPVNDLRVAAAIVADEAGLETTFELTARDQVMEFTIAGGTARVRMRSSLYPEDEPDEGWVGPPPVEINPLRAGRATDVEFWHVDQALSIFVDGERVVHFPYDWHPVERLQHATGRTGDAATLAAFKPSGGPALRWHFRGSPVTLHRVRVDRDLYYRSDRLGEPALKNPASPGIEDTVRTGRHAYGTHPQNVAILGPEHFFMAGDNSPASSDSRLWGYPHPLVATQIDPSPFVVHRTLLLGKAWVVYFPAPYAMTETGRAFVPSFGRLRFIR